MRTASSTVGDEPHVKGSRKLAYAEFLRSQTWRSIREAALAQHGSVCQVCGHPHGVQLHHLFYAHPWSATFVSHLMPLCRFHHRIVGDLAGRGITTIEAEIEALRAQLIAGLPQRSMPRSRRRRGRLNKWDRKLMKARSRIAKHARWLAKPGLEDRLVRHHASMLDHWQRRLSEFESSAPKPDAIVLEVDELDERLDMLVDNE